MSLIVIIDAGDKGSVYLSLFMDLSLTTVFFSLLQPSVVFAKYSIFVFVYLSLFLDFDLFFHKGVSVTHAILLNFKQCGGFVI
ncbi:hypothetical protein KSS87_009151 [Heliosperma pusillum]|nr:hypothetical protein KSS87_009151 [Heliosperma pusillum]